MLSRHRSLTLALAAALGLLLGSADALTGQGATSVVPAKAGTQGGNSDGSATSVIPAKAGTQGGNSDSSATSVIPAKAGTQGGGAEDPARSETIAQRPPANATTAEQPESLLVAARDLPRGSSLEAGDIAGGDGSGLVGWVTRRVITAGEPLRAPAVAPAQVVRSGDDVQLVWSEGALVLRMSGRAMNSAAVGERVMVRIDTQRRFEGIAQAPGEVRLASPATK